MGKASDIWTYEPVGSLFFNRTVLLTLTVTELGPAMMFKADSENNTY